MPTFGLDSSNSTLNGDAYYSGDRIQLTDAVRNEVGVVNTNDKYDLTKDFTFKFSADFGNAGGADGIGWIMHNTPAGAGATGNAGNYLGVSEGDFHDGGFISIAFDTLVSSRINGGKDFSQLNVNGTKGPFVDLVGDADDLQDGADHPIEINWDAATRTLSWSVDGTQVSSQSFTEPELINIFGADLTADFGVGAGTGALVNAQSIGDIEVTAELPVIPCFVRGTEIETLLGPRRVEDLLVDDMVKTMDHGYQPIRWIGSSKRLAVGDLAPILIRKGALGNARDLRVSPQHRMMYSGALAELLFGQCEVLVTAKSLVDDHSILRVAGGEVEYFHMMFDKHEIIFAEGSPSESFFPGDQALLAVDRVSHKQLLSMLPKQGPSVQAPEKAVTARLCLKHHEGQCLVKASKVRQGSLSKVG